MATHKSAAEIEREIDQQRGRIEARIEQLRDRLSPGQLLDEALSYTRDGGAELVGNFGRQLGANPLPAALTGIGLGWLIAANLTQGSRAPAQDAVDDAYEIYHPYAEASESGLTRVRNAADEAGRWWSEFQTESGQRYKAASDEAGRRAGHFVDETGRRFSGFVDRTGAQVKKFQDETGKALDESLGWAGSHWHAAQERLGRGLEGMGDAAAQLGNSVAAGSRRVAGMAQDAGSQTTELGRQAMRLFDQQPLVAGALAFAAGAALGAVLPRTEQEDELLGAEADRIRNQARAKAGELYEEGKQQASHLYDEANQEAADIYSETRDRIAERARNVH